jgi:nucleoid-associated protein YgaU
MGNFEKLSVLVIGVIIVMILVVALYTWTDDPSGDTPTPPEESALNASSASPSPAADRAADTSGGWITWTERPAEPVPAERASTGATTAAPAEATAAAAASPAAETPAADAPAAERTYVVKPGQTLSHVSIEVYGTSKHWKRIAERNDIDDPARVRAGTTLYIPALQAEEGRTAENKPTETASRTGSGPHPGESYTVKAGDTIQGIAKAAYGKMERWPDIWLENFERLENPEALRTGMTLRIPQ